MVVTDFSVKISKLRERGAVLAELAIGLPLFLILFIGLVHFGRMFSQLSWLNYAACQTAELGSTMDANYGGGAMQKLWNTLYSDAYGRGDSSLDPNSSSYFNVAYDETNRAVQVSARPSVSKLVNYAANTLGISCNSGYLVNTIDSLENFREFANSSPTKFFDCAGNETSSPISAPCNWSPPIPPTGGGNWCTCFSADTPILMSDGTQKPISEIKVGEMVIGYDENTGKQVSAKVSDLLKRTSEDYYLINDKIRVTSEHPFYVDGQWIKTKDLKIGQKLLGLDGKAVSLNSKQLNKEALEVFNLTVDGVHTYFASGVLVHNKTRCDETRSSTRSGT